MRGLRVLFADDELMAGRRMRRQLASIEGVEIVAECVSGEGALAKLEQIDVDLALLDVRMGGLSGIEVSEAAAELGVEIGFTTAHAEHAVAAFDAGAVDFVVKPIDRARLEVAIDRARQRIEALRATAASRAAPSGARPVERLALTVRGEIRLVDPRDVSHALLEGELVTVFVEHEGLVTDLSLQDLGRRLSAGSFERVHRRALLNLEHVVRLKPQPTGGYRAVTKAGHEVPVSRQAARGLRRRLGIGAP